MKYIFFIDFGPINYSQDSPMWQTRNLCSLGCYAYEFRKLGGERFKKRGMLGMFSLKIYRRIIN